MWLAFDSCAGRRYTWSKRARWERLASIKGIRAGRVPVPSRGKTRLVRQAGQGGSLEHVNAHSGRAGLRRARTSGPQAKAVLPQRHQFPLRTSSRLHDLAHWTRRTRATLVDQAQRVASRIAWDAPFGWRATAHGVVLSITLAVFISSQLGTFSVAAALGADQPSRLAEWAWRASQDSSVFRMLSVASSTSESETASGMGGTPEESGPGFVSPGMAPEADPALLPWDEPQVYVVQAGDTISGIADQFGISSETLLYANPAIRKDPHSLSIGDTLTILPIDGVLHVVEEGDTLDSIAEKYKASVTDILAYAPNGLSADRPLIAGSEIVVPGGEMEIVIPSMYQVQDYGRRSMQVWASDGGRGPVAGSGNFHIATYGRITQGFTRWHAAVDIANATGTPVYAVDSGTVEVAGWVGPLGNAVVIDHGNGFESLYGHLSTVNVANGQSVQRGQIIGTIGCTRGRGGRCTGPHLHLEIYQNGARVPPCSVGACP